MAKIKEKIWYDVLAPEVFNSVNLGSVVSADPQNLIGRTIEADSVTLMNDPSKYYMNFIFKISEVNGTKAKTRVFRYECTRDYLARMVQPRTSRIFMSEIFQIKGSKLRIKIIAITNRQTTLAINKKIRKKMLEIISRKTISLDEFLKEFISGKMQNEIRAELNKIYPIRRIDIIKFQVL